MRTLVGAAVVLAVAGCGLDRGGLGAASVDGGASGAVDASGGSSGGGSGGGSGGSADAATVDAPVTSWDGGASCASTVPAGWTVVAYETTQGPCASSLGASHDVYAGATIQSGACGCTCGVTSQPSCVVGNLITQYSNQPPSGSGQCPNAGQSLQVTGTGCIGLGGGSLGGGFSAEPLPMTGGVCGGTLAVDPSKLSKNGVRYCDVPSSIADSVCAGSSPPGFSACIVSSGAVACPSGPFSNRTVVEDDDVLVCPTCDSCHVTGTCTGAQLVLYADQQCQAQVAQFPVDGQCVGAGGQGVGSAKYSAQAQVSCSASASGAPAVNPGPQHTLCCR